MRRRRDSAPDPVLPAAVLPLLATGEYLAQADGERQYGPTFNGWDALIETHPRDWPQTWRDHQAEIEAHARRLGLDRPWVLDYLGEAVC